MSGSRFAFTTLPFFLLLALFSEPSVADSFDLPPGWIETKPHGDNLYNVAKLSERADLLSYFSVQKHTLDKKSQLFIKILDKTKPFSKFSDGANEFTLTKKPNSESSCYEIIRQRKKATPPMIQRWCTAGGSILVGIEQGELLPTDLREEIFEKFGLGL